MLNFVSDAVTQYNINQNCVRVAVIRYGNNHADAQLQLYWYNDVRSVVSVISRIQMLGGSSTLAPALNLLRSQVFASNSVRQNTVRIAIIVTDWLQSSPQITAAANSVKSQGITIVAVAITGRNRVDVNALLSIVSNRWIVQVVNYTQLVTSARNTIVQQYACFPFTTTPLPTTTRSPSEYNAYRRSFRQNIELIIMIIIIIIIKRQFIRRSIMARVTTRAPYNVRCSYSGNSQ